MNYLKSLGFVKKQKDAGYKCNYCQFECDSQLQMIHHNSCCFFSQYDEMKKRTGLRKTQQKEHEKKQKKAIRNLLNLQRFQNNLGGKNQDCNENITSMTEGEQQKINTLQNQNDNIFKQLFDEKFDLNQQENIQIKGQTFIHQDDQFMIKGQEDDFLLSMIALKNRSDLRLILEWPKHQRFPKQLKLGINSNTDPYIENQFKGNQEESLKDIQLSQKNENNMNNIQQNEKILDNCNSNLVEDYHQNQTYKFNSDDAFDINNVQSNESNIEQLKQYKQNDKQEFNSIQSFENPENQLILSKEFKEEKILESQTSKSHLNQKNLQIQQNQQPNFLIVKNSILDNQDKKSEIITNQPSKINNDVLNDEDDQISIDPNSNSKKFYNVLEQAHFELICRDQLKEVHKILREYYEKVRLDTLGIDNIWGLLKSKHSQTILNYQQLLKCLLDLHDQEKVQFDEQKQIVYLI